MFIIKLTNFAATSSSIPCNNIYDIMKYAHNNMTSWKMLILKADPDYRLQSYVHSVLIWQVFFFFSSSFLLLLHKPDIVKKVASALKAMQ